MARVNDASGTALLDDKHEIEGKKCFTEQQQERVTRSDNSQSCRESAQTTIEGALKTLIINAFFFSHASTARKFLPFIMDALKQIGVTTVNVLLRQKPSFSQGGLESSEIDAFALEVRKPWANEDCEWWPPQGGNEEVRECWRILILGSRFVEIGDRTCAGDEDWTALENIGLRRYDCATEMPQRGLRCDVPGSECLHVVQELARSSVRARALVAAEIVAAAGDLRRGHLKRDFAHAWLMGVQLHEAQLSGAKMEGANIAASDFTNAVMTEIDIRNCFAGYSSFCGVNLGWALAQNSGFSFSNLHGASLKCAKVMGCNFFRTDFRAVSMAGADFTGATLKECSFSMLKVPQPRALAATIGWRHQAAATTRSACATLTSTMIDDDEGDEGDADDEDERSGGEDGALDGADLQQKAQTSIDEHLERLASLAVSVLPKLDDLKTCVLIWINTPSRVAEFQKGICNVLESAEVNKEKWLVDMATRKFITPLFDKPGGKLPELLNDLFGAARPAEQSPISPSPTSLGVGCEAGALESEAGGEAFPSVLLSAAGKAFLDALEEYLLVKLRADVQLETEALITQLVAREPRYGLADEEALIQCASLHAGLRDCVSRGLQKQARAALFSYFSGASGSMSRVAWSMHEVAGRLDRLETKIGTKLHEAGEPPALLARFAPVGSFRRQFFHNALHQTTTYSISDGACTGSLDMLRLAWRRSRRELLQDEAEISYLLERLQKLEEEKMTESSWKDVCESWQATLKLRARINVGRGQAVIESILADPGVIFGLGAAEAMLESIGDAPADLLTILSQGPGAHIRNHAYSYRKVLDRECIRIQRVKELQTRAIALLGSAVVAAMIGVANFLSQLAFAAWEKSSLSFSA